MTPRQSPKFETWMEWTVAAVVATAALVTFAYANFETRDHAHEQMGVVKAELQAINSKLDVLGGWAPKKVSGH